MYTYYNIEFIFYYKLLEYTKYSRQTIAYSLIILINK